VRFRHRITLELRLIAACDPGHRYAIEERVLSSQEFRDFAHECLAWAKTAKSDNERDIFLQMAQVWLEAAVRSEIGPTKAHRARQDVIARLAR